jgi:hypothetical protein
MTTIAEAVFRVDVMRTELAAGGAPLAVTGIQLDPAEDGTGVVLLFEVRGQWYASGFDLPVRIDPDNFDREYYETEALRLLRQWAH